MKTLEQIKSTIETNIRAYLIAEEQRDREFCKEYDFTPSFKKSDYDYLVRINENDTAVSIIFEGGLFYDLINTHFTSTGEGAEDYIEDSWFCHETAENIFGLAKYDWSPYASYQIDVHA